MGFIRKISTANHLDTRFFSPDSNTTSVSNYPFPLTSNSLHNIYQRQKLCFIYTILSDVVRDTKKKENQSNPSTNKAYFSFEYLQVAVSKFNKLKEFFEDEGRYIPNTYVPSISFPENTRAFSIVELELALNFLKKHRKKMRKQWKFGYIRSFTVLKQLYRIIGVPDESILKEIRENSVEWYVKRILDKAEDWRTTENGKVGRYIHKHWDCYDFLTALIYSAINPNIESALDVKDSEESNWDTNYSILRLGYKWSKAHSGKVPPNWLKEGMFVFFSRFRA